jgi:hypothetical protein
MTTIKEKTVVDEITGFQCDACKKIFESNLEYVEIKHTFGYRAEDEYGNSLDMSKITLSLCEPCFYSLLKREQLHTLICNNLI